MEAEVVYLDQNILSAIAKVHLRQIKEPRFQRLYQRLESLVKEGKVVCPQSTFHYIESGLGSEVLRSKIMEIINHLSQGIRFRGWQELLDIQMTRAVTGFFRLRPEKPSKKEAILKLSKAGLEVSPDIVRELEKKKRLYINRWQELRDEIFLGLRQRGLPEQTFRLFKGRREEERRAFVDGYFLRPKRGEPSLSTYILEAYHIEPPIHPRRTSPALSCYKEYDPYFNRYGAFLVSPALRAVPFLDIISSVNATILVYEEARGPEAGDFYDVQIIATILPYTGVLTTDNFMKSILIERLGFDKKYGAKVFSARGRDVDGLIAHLEGL